MKKIILTTLISFLAFQLTFAQESYTKDISQLPVKAREFIEKNYPNEKVSYILIDKEIMSIEYEAVLTNRHEIKFDKNGEWKEIEGKKTALPESVIPQVALSYIKTNFPGISIEQIEREYWGYEIELMNGIDIKIDKKGKLLEIDN